MRSITQGKDKGGISDQSTSPTMSINKLKPGVYAPVLVPFSHDGNENILFDAFLLQVKRLAAAGVGLVISGTLGEATLLTRDERRDLVKAARTVLDEAGFDVAVIAGIGAGSVKESIEYARDAKAAGADAW
jgi:4-hydroxy-2-oxoglutarate aldolase